MTWLDLTRRLFSALTVTNAFKQRVNPPAYAALWAPMSSIQRLVSPKLPTTLASHTHVDLPGQDIWLHYTKGVLALPAKLDLSKFEDALSRVLQLYPHAAGHIRWTEGHWSIELTNSDIPLEIDYKHDVDRASLLDGDWVAQHDLSPFMNQQPISTELFNANVPLLRLKITYFNHETYIGVLWNHSLGDGITSMRFMHMLSQFYQELPPKFAVPTFQKHIFPAPSDAVMAEFSSYIPLGLLADTGETTSTPALEDIDHVRWRIDTHDLEVLRSALCSDKPDGKYLSKQDCLTAYIIAVLNSSRKNPIRKATNTCSYRHINAPFITDSVAGNLLLFTATDVPTDMAGIATAIRETRMRSRDPRFIYNMEVLESNIFLEAANACKPPPFPTDDAGLIVNSHGVIDWHSVHFGYPNGVRMYISGLRKNFLKCMKSNPVRGEDGIWRERESIEISIGVSAESKPKVLETLGRGVRYMLNGRSARL